MFYLLGSLLFVLAMTASVAVMASEITRYRRAIMKALRGLSLEGWNGTEQQSATTAPAIAYSPCAGTGAAASRLLTRA